MAVSLLQKRHKAEDRRGLGSVLSSFLTFPSPIYLPSGTPPNATEEPNQFHFCSVNVRLDILENLIDGWPEIACKKRIIRSEKQVIIPV